MAGPGLPAAALTPTPQHGGSTPNQTAVDKNRQNRGIGRSKVSVRHYQIAAVGMAKLSQ